ncbi:MAG: histidine--tRNA ligase [Clostridiales bacterium]|jgi:histidyl-tRNA synthetase|nr:histidine--tRNA ligase [Clostridiales bacterium]
MPKKSDSGTPAADGGSPVACNGKPMGGGSPELGGSKQMGDGTAVMRDGRTIGNGSPADYDDPPYKKPKGTNDILPHESHKWRRAERIMRETCDVFGFREIRVPVFERTEVFARGVGDSSDIVRKEMYTFEDRKMGRSLTLRPEGTAGVVRSFIENGMSSLPMPVRLFYIITAYRHENVQKGRYREFNQFGAEVFGSARPDCDAEAISMAKLLFDRLGLQKTDLRINSIGCPECRQGYNRLLKEFFAPKIAGMCADCKDRLERNPLRIIDCKEERCREAIDGAPMPLDHLCDGCREHFEGLEAALGALGLQYSIDRRIVRGLDYYNRTVFEFVSGNVGTQGTICGGGRYDGLVSLLGGPATPAVGFSMGIERLLMEMESVGAAAPEPSGTLLYVVTSGERANNLMRPLVYKLRSEGYNIDMDIMGRSVKACMKYANKQGSAYSAVIGDDELASGEASLRDMATGESRSVRLSGFLDAARQLARG